MARTHARSPRGTRAYGTAPFGGILRAGLSGDNPINVKLLLRQRFGTPTASVEQVVRFTRIDGPRARLLGAEEGDAAMQLEVTGFDTAAAPITYHEILIPSTDCVIDLTYSGAPVRASR